MTERHIACRWLCRRLGPVCQRRSRVLHGYSYSTITAAIGSYLHARVRYSHSTWLRRCRFDFTSPMDGPQKCGFGNGDRPLTTPRPVWYQRRIAGNLNSRHVRLCNYCQQLAVAFLTLYRSMACCCAMTTICFNCECLKWSRGLPIRITNVEFAM